MRRRDTSRDDRPRWQITALSRLSGTREIISGHMTYEECERRLEREIMSRSRQRYRPYVKFRIEYDEGVQLELRFGE